jgi:hypothetical protein
MSAPAGSTPPAPAGAAVPPPGGDNISGGGGNSALNAWRISLDGSGMWGVVVLFLLLFGVVSMIALCFHTRRLARRRLLASSAAARAAAAAAAGLDLPMVPPGHRLGVVTESPSGRHLIILGLPASGAFSDAVPLASAARARQLLPGRKLPTPARVIASLPTYTYSASRAAAGSDGKSADVESGGGHADADAQREVRCGGGRRLSREQIASGSFVSACCSVDLLQHGACGHMGLPPRAARRAVAAQAMPSSRPPPFPRYALSAVTSSPRGASSSCCPACTRFAQSASTPGWRAPRTAPCARSQVGGCLGFLGPGRAVPTGRGQYRPPPMCGKKHLRQASGSSSRAHWIYDARGHALLALHYLLQSAVPLALTAAQSSRRPDCPRRRRSKW